MPRRSTEEVLAEFHRVSDRFEALLAVLRTVIPGFMLIDGVDHVTPRADMLRWVAEKKATASEILSGVREALDELVLAVVDAQRVEPAMGRAILDQYKARTGRALWDDVGPPKKFVLAILRRGRIETEDEARLINEILSDLGSSLLTDTQREKASALLGTYETGSAS